MLVGGCFTQHLEVRGDARGSLVAIEGGGDVPFDVARVYYIFGTKPNVARGFHAHRDLEQLVIATSGACTLTLDDGERREAVRLDRPDLGLRIRSLVWREMSDFTPDCVLLVLASHHYDEADYLRDYDQFLAAVRQSGSEQRA